MKTVTYGWLIKKYPAPSLDHSSNKYQYYYCPNDAENPYIGTYKMVKIKKDYVIKQNKIRFPSEERI